MSETNRSQVQQNPFASLVEAQAARVEALYAQVAEMEAKALDRSRSSIEESARLSRETLEYGATLAAEWRKASLEAMRRSAEMFSTPFFPFMS